MKANNTIKLIFPGKRYSIDRSLLYFLDKYIDGESIYFEYDSPRYLNDSKNINEIIDDAYNFSKEILESKKLDEYTEVIVIAKSIGTLVATKLRNEKLIKASKFILLTPINETIPFLKQGDFIVTSLKDSYVDASLLKAKENYFPFLTIYEDLPHSLEYANNFYKTFDLQKEILDNAINYLDISYKDIVEQKTLQNPNIFVEF